MRSAHPNRPEFNRPDFLSRSAAEDEESHRILAALESSTGRGQRHHKRFQAYTSRGRIVIASLALICLATGWIAYSSTFLSLQTWDKLKGGAIAGIYQNNLKTNASLTSAGLLDKQKQPATRSQAALINDESAAKFGAIAKIESDKAAPKAIPETKDEATGKSSIETPVTPLQKARANVPAPTMKAPPRIRDVDPAAAKVVRKPLAGQSRPQAGLKPDTDVALLAALIAVVNEEQSDNPTRPQPFNVLNRGTSGGPPKHEIAERSAGNSTEFLLARCRELGFLEGALCRWRICSKQDSSPICEIAAR